MLHGQAFWIRYHFISTSNVQFFFLICGRGWINFRLFCISLNNFIHLQKSYQTTNLDKVLLPLYYKRNIQKQFVPSSQTNCILNMCRHVSVIVTNYTDEQREKVKTEKDRRSRRLTICTTPDGDNWWYNSDRDNCEYSDVIHQIQHFRKQGSETLQQVLSFN